MQKNSYRPTHARFSVLTRICSRTSHLVTPCTQYCTVSMSMDLSEVGGAMTSNNQNDLFLQTLHVARWLEKFLGNTIATNSSRHPRFFFGGKTSENVAILLIRQFIHRWSAGLLYSALYMYSTRQLYLLVIYLSLVLNTEIQPHFPPIL